VSARGIQLLLAWQWQPDELREQPHVEGVCGHGRVNGKPCTQEQVHEGLREADDVKPDEPVRRLQLLRALEAALHEQQDATTKLQNRHEQVAVHLADGQFCQIANVFAVQQKLLDAHVLLLVLAPLAKLGVEKIALAVVPENIGEAV